MISSLDSLTEEIITQRLRMTFQSNPVLYSSGNSDQTNVINQIPRHAAVLVPFLRKKNSWHLLFTKRTDKLVEHSGQVAFPGGQLDSDDETIEAGALREAREEIGLQTDDVKLLGKLPPLLTITNYLVTPVIGKIPWPYQFSLETDEVNRVFTIPLNWLAESTNYKITEHKLPDHSNRFLTIYYKTYDHETLWGVSARITLNLIHALLI